MDVVVAVRMLVGLLLLSSGLFKAVDFGGFCLAVRGYGLVGRRAASSIVAAIVVSAECVLGGALILGWLPRLSGVMAVGMLFAFSLAGLLAVMRGHANAKCGCKLFGGNDRIGWQLWVRNISFVCFLLPSVRALPNRYVAVILSLGAVLIILGVALADLRQAHVRVGALRRASE